MVEMRSNLIVAQQLATELLNASDAVANVSTTVPLATRTTVSGNKNAVTDLTNYTELTNSLIQAFNQDIENIASVAEEFERIDQEVAVQFATPLEIARGKN